MIKTRSLAWAVVVFLVRGSVASAQTHKALPDRPFKTFHLMAVEPSKESALKAAINDFNRDFIKEGCSACSYHLLQMFVGSQGPYNFIVYADWPNQDAYTRIHASATYASTAARNPVFAELEDKQFYGRFVEVK